MLQHAAQHHSVSKMNTSNPYNRAIVLGGGAWGTALACVAARAGLATQILCRTEAQAALINDTRTNPKYLGDLKLEDDFTATTDPEQIRAADVVILAIPTQSLRDSLPIYKPYIAPDAVLLNSAKGIELSTGKLVSAIIRDVMGDQQQAILSGPSFARDVVAGLPTAVTIAAPEKALAMSLSEHLSSPRFRIYASTDMDGVEVGGALKNVYALAAGIVNGLGLGDSAKAAIITRAFVEFIKLGEAMGGTGQTFHGLSGFGDLMLTCSSPLSRNFAYGTALGQGDDVEGLKLAEGVPTSRIAYKIATERGIEAPILAIVKHILDGEVTSKQAVSLLLERPIKPE
jgi:glycerol-3-phosphate dehydrogenase (NAD(P)+)